MTLANAPPRPSAVGPKTSCPGTQLLRNRERIVSRSDCPNFLPAEQSPLRRDFAARPRRPRTCEVCPWRRTPPRRRRATRMDSSHPRFPECLVDRECLICRSGRLLPIQYRTRTPPSGTACPPFPRWSASLYSTCPVSHVHQREATPSPSRRGLKPSLPNAPLRPHEFAAPVEAS
jgi:hypothetical protein